VKRVSSGIDNDPFYEDDHGVYLVPDELWQKYLKTFETLGELEREMMEYYHP
jgi:hypothetical protein